MDFRKLDTNSYDLKCINCGEKMELTSELKEEKTLWAKYVCHECGIESFMTSAIPNPGGTKYDL